MNVGSLQAQFRQLGFDDDFTNRKEFREINAIDNYGRICQHVSRAARSYDRSFRHMLLNVVPHDMPTHWHRAKRFVHAEIQLLIGRDIHPKSHAARSIGTSKKACLLCYLFLRAHGRYNVSQTHGEVMPQWTVPDTRDYNLDSLERICTALGVMGYDVKAAIRVAASIQANIPLGLARIGAHSTKHLYCAPLRTPSLATLAAIKEDNVPEATSVVDRSSDMSVQELLLANAMPEVKSDGLARASPGSSILQIPLADSLPEEESTGTSATETLLMTSLTVTAPAKSIHEVQSASTVTPREGLASPILCYAASDSSIDLEQASKHLSCQYLAHSPQDFVI